MHWHKWHKSRGRERGEWQTCNFFDRYNSTTYLTYLRANNFPIFGIDIN